MQGALELGLIAILFIGLQVWWVSKVLLNRPRQPTHMDSSKPSRSIHATTNAMLWKGSLERHDVQHALH